MSKTLPLSRLRAFLALPPDAMVPVYTLQNPAAVEVAKARGYLTCDPAHVFDETDWAPDGSPLYLAKAYHWMRDRMAERIPDFSGDLPVFTWLKRPANTGLPSSFGSMTCVKAVVPRQRILVSWHDYFLSVANGWAVDPLEVERGDEARNWSLEEIEASWMRILDVEDTDFWTSPAKPRDEIQACVDRIYVKEIRWVKPMRVRGKSDRKGKIHAE